MLLRIFNYKILFVYIPYLTIFFFIVGQRPEEGDRLCRHAATDYVSYSAGHYSATKESDVEERNYRSNKCSKVIFLHSLGTEADNNWTLQG